MRRPARASLRASFGLDTTASAPSALRPEAERLGSHRRAPERDPRPRGPQRAEPRRSARSPPLADDAPAAAPLARRVAPRDARPRVRARLHDAVARDPEADPARDRRSEE